MAKHTDAPAEIELKLLLPPDGRAKLESLPRLHDTAPERRDEVTTYFDTDDQVLAAHGFTLRVRASGATRVQTLKGAAADDGAAANRAEWEWPVAQDTPVLERLAGTAAAALVPALHGRLRPLFASHIERLAHSIVLPEGTQVEVALDRGAIVAGEHSMPVDEVELELKHGPIAPLWRMAIELHEAAPMRIAPESKSARGQRLRSGADPEARHAATPALRPGDSAAGAFRAIVGSALAQVTGNVAAAEAGTVDGIHQLRIGLRRLRSALVLFAPLLDRRAAAGFERELRTLGQVLGARRDRDVLCGETLPAATQALGAGWIDLLRPLADADRGAALGPVRAALHGSAFTSVVLGLAAWCEDGAEHPRRLGRKRLGRPFRAVAPALLDRLADTVDRRMRRADTPRRRHALRKSLKKLRYATEFVEGLYPAKAARAYRKRCEALQELLGAANDASITASLVGGLVQGPHVELAPGAATLERWSEARGATSAKRLRRATRRFRAAQPFWR